jgi:hypothetical protein
VIYRKYAFTLDWKFLVKNVVMVGILCGVMWVLKGSVSVGGRWELFLWLLVFFVGYGVVLAGMNWRKVNLFLTEIRNLKKK